MRLRQNGCLFLVHSLTFLYNSYAIISSVFLRVLHRVLDVVMNADHNRVHKDQGPENKVVLRHLVLNFLKQEKTANGNIHSKQLQSTWNNDSLRKVLAAGI